MISGISYNFGSDGALQQGSGKNGIDVSSHQGNIDWASVKAAGINFAIIRVGYRGSQTGALVEDSCFKKNIQGATANGINVGVSSSHRLQLRQKLLRRQDGIDLMLRIQSFLPDLC